MELCFRCQYSEYLGGGNNMTDDNNESRILIYYSTYVPEQFRLSRRLLSNNYNELILLAVH